eukprot:6189581-Pleurochrysis_carterae.AAC.2
MPRGSIGTACGSCRIAIDLFVAVDSLLEAVFAWRSHDAAEGAVACLYSHLHARFLDDRPSNHRISSHHLASVLLSSRRARL